MYLPPAQILNELAKTVKLKHKAIETLFKMGQDELDQFLNEQAKALERAGHDPKVVIAYQALEPLLLENEAISQFVEKMGDSSLRMTLPEILSKNEAVEIADRELMLTPAQRTSLFKLLH